MNNPEAVQILVVDANPTDVLLVQEAFAEARTANRVHVVADSFQALAFLRREVPFHDAPRPDVILLDINMPRMSGVDLQNS